MNQTRRGANRVRSSIRATPGLLVALTIVLGLLSRAGDWAPLWIGDVLWGSTTFFLAWLVLPRALSKLHVVMALLFCYSIEASQLYQAPWINDIRGTTIGYLVLGNGFSWADLACYTIGVGGALAVQRISGSRPGN